MGNQVITAFALRPTRWNPVGMDPRLGHLFEESGVLDYVSAPDVLSVSSFIPPQLEPTRVLGAPDNDSWYDPAIALAVAAVKHPGLGVIHGGVNAIRNAPAELFRAGLTLAGVTHGRAMVWVAVGERYNVTPFGYSRAEGLARLEDHFRLYQLLWERDSPFDFDGNVWKFRSATIGAERSHRPGFWAMGAGPKLTSIAAKYADGWVTNLPMAEPTPEAYAMRVRAIRDEVERNGRDPDAFGFAIIPNCLIHDDEELIRESQRNPMIRFLAAMWGRAPQSRWLDEGIEPAFPVGWEYSVKWDSRSFSDTDFAALQSRISDAMVERSFFAGSAKVVAADLRAYVDAGATLVQPIDMLGLGAATYGDAYEPDTIRWRLEIYRDLKAAR